MPRNSKIINDPSKSSFGSSLRTPVFAARAPVDGARALGGAAGIGAAKRLEGAGGRCDSDHL